MNTMRTETLEIAFEEHGPADGWPVILSHGFPYDVRAYDEVTPILASSGARLIVPYLRGFGPTRFLSGSTMRSGQQAALGRDLFGLIDGLGLETRSSPVSTGVGWPRASRAPSGRSASPASCRSRATTSSTSAGSATRFRRA